MQKHIRAANQLHARAKMLVISNVQAPVYTDNQIFVLHTIGES